MPLPADARFGTVTATFPVLPTGLQVRFRPDLLSPVVRLTTVTPPLTFVLDEVVATVNSSGQLCGEDGQPGVQLLADPDLEPHDWTWRAQITSYEAAAVEFSFAVTAGTVVDLSDLVPIPPDLGIALELWVQAVTAAEAARDAAITAAANVQAGSAAAISDAIAALVGSAPAALDTLQEIDATIASDEGSAAALAALVASKAPRDSPTFTGTVSGITAAMVAADPAGAAAAITLAGLGGLTQAQIDARVTALADAKGAAAAITLAGLGGAPSASPTFTGTVAGVSKAMVGLGNVDNTADTAKPVSTAQAAALALKADQAAVAATYPTLPKNARNGLTGWWHVDGYGAKGDNSTDDATAIQAAIDACTAAGGGRVYVPRLPYVIGSSLVPKSGVTVVSDGGQIRTSASIPGFNATTTAFTDFALDGLVFVGTVNQFPSGPQRGRTTSGAGMTMAVQMSGDLDTNNPGNAALTNFTMRNCAVRNCSSLPILIRGLRGVVRVTSNEFTNNMDAGFTFNQEVIFTGNHVQMSADNGVSVSRGNTKVTVTGNTFENCCYWGIWVSGFNTDLGPTNFTVTGNTIKNVGFGGIQADAAAKYGTIVGNAIDCGYNRGPSDQPTDSWGCGVYVGGLPTGSSTPTALAKNILVGHNQIRTAPRAGIILNGAQSVKVSGNLIADYGTQYLADGTTAILASDTNNNVGILVLNSTTSLNLTIDTNTMIDERSTPYGNWSIIPIIAPATSNYWGNTHQGLRNTYNLQEQTAAGSGSRTFRDVISFSSNTKHVGGVTAGSNAGGGIANGLDVNGAAGVVRPFRVLTAGSERWRLYGDTTAEAGSNAGTNLVLESHDDSGTLLATLLTALRTGSMTFGVQAQPVTIKSRLVSGAASAAISAGANASAVSAGGNGANDTAGTVNATVVASGASAGGALVTVTFATAYSAVPHVQVTPQSSQSASCQPYVSARSATGFTISSVNAPTASAALQYDYIVFG